MTIYVMMMIYKVKNMYVRTNILLRKFGKCSFNVKLKLFRTYCRGGSTLGPGGTGPPNVGQAPPPKKNILVPTAKIRILKI